MKKIVHTSEVTCDDAECSGRLAAPTSELRRIGENLGWSLAGATGSNLDLCPKHAPVSVAG